MFFKMFAGNSLKEKKIGLPPSSPQPGLPDCRRVPPAGAAGLPQSSPRRRGRTATEAPPPELPPSSAAVRHVGFVSDVIVTAGVYGYYRERRRVSGGRRSRSG